MRDIGVEHFHIYLLEARDCKTKQEAFELEQEWMDELCALDPRFGFNIKSAVSQMTEAEYVKKWAESHREVTRKHAQAYRQRKLEEDPVGYRAHRAAQARAQRKKRAQQGESSIDS